MKGYKEKPRIDYLEVFAPVARLKTVRMIVSLIVHNSWKIFQIVIKSIFFNNYFSSERDV